jgi:hypothetical protein
METQRSVMAKGLTVDNIMKLVVFILKNKATVKRVKKLRDELELLSTSSKPRRAKVRTPKLKAIKNPNSKYYDTAPGLTKKLSLIFYNHQRANRRFKHERITNNDRQWVLLVGIKDRILKRFGNGKFIAVSTELFRQAELLSKKKGKANLYLTWVVYSMEELLDKVEGRLSLKITEEERQFWIDYQRHKLKMTGITSITSITSITDGTEFEAGSDDHYFTTEALEIINRFGIKVSDFLKIHFDAFRVHDSFPSISNMVTDKAILRLERGIIKHAAARRTWSDRDKKNESYWRELENRIKEQQGSKAGN